MKNLVIYSIQEIWHCVDSLKIFGVRLDSFGYTYVNSYKDIQRVFRLHIFSFVTKEYFQYYKKKL